MKEIKEILLANRPNLSKGSLTTYSSILRNLHLKIRESDDAPFDLKDFLNKDRVLGVLNELKPSQRKTIIAAIIVLLGDDEKHKEYKDELKSVMLDDIKQHNTETIEQKKSETADWIDWEDVDMVYKGFKRDATPLFKQQRLTSKEKGILQDFVLLSLYVLIPPRRSLDYCLLKFRGEGEGDNYIDFKNNKLVFNRYKTNKFYGTQEVDLNPTLKAILKKWIDKIKDGESDYLLNDSKGKPLSNITLNQRLNRIFGMKVSVNALRHSFLSNKYKNMPNLKEMLNTADDMGHSLMQAFEYVKK